MVEKKKNSDDYWTVHLISNSECLRVTPCQDGKFQIMSKISIWCLGPCFPGILSDFNIVTKAASPNDAIDAIDAIGYGSHLLPL